jgi:hypothetical protein
MNTSQMNTSQMNASHTNNSSSPTNFQSPIILPPKKNNYKNMMSELMKPLPKEDKPNIHLGGGTFQKLEKI